MRFFKTVLYILAVLVLQTVVFPRLNFMGVIPDLFLVSVVAFAVLAERTPATNHDGSWPVTLFSAFSAFLQDVLSTGIYFNTILKVVIGNVVCSIKERFIGDEYFLAAGMVLIFSPLYLFLTDGVIHFHFLYFVFRVVATTIYNLLMVLLLFPIVKVIARGD